ncbi:MAG TPA: alanine racemase [Anaerolineae bacterium]|mgnify:CR=1 FL=1|nr:alanine racemase [Anaerolineae bacterium]HQK15048.1 alanine racemase [Anaerolineae bacterium]
MIPDGVVTWAEIDLDAIAHNVRAIKDFVGPNTEIIASVKANAYGHGLLPIARTALEAGASRLAIHRVQVAVILRESGITAPILIMGHVPPSGVDLILRNHITPTLTNRETAQLISARAEEPVPVHIKIDTGMSRYGLDAEKVVDFVRYVASLPNLRVEGLFTHFATADEPDLTHARRQLERFQAILDELARIGYPIAVPHICNSAGLVRFPEAHMAAVRPGLLIYGMAPSPASTPPFPIKRALTLKTTVINVRDLAPGTAISYGRTFIAQKPIRVALIPLGYGDGYPRQASNRGAVLIRGQRAPICGRICMDQMVVEVTDIPGVCVGDEAVAIGPQGDDEITAEEVATWSDSINYEVVTGLLPQVVRIYKLNGYYPAPYEGVEQWRAYLRAL